MPVYFNLFFMFFDDSIGRCRRNVVCVTLGVVWHRLSSINISFFHCWRHILIFSSTQRIVFPQTWAHLSEVGFFTLRSSFACSVLSQWIVSVSNWQNHTLLCNVEALFRLYQCDQWSSALLLLLCVVHSTANSFTWPDFDRLMARADWLLHFNRLLWAQLGANAAATSIQPVAKDDW